jgi:hypothetical protein
MPGKSPLKTKPLRNLGESAANQLWDIFYDKVVSYGDPSAFRAFAQ